MWQKNGKDFCTKNAAARSWFLAEKNAKSLSHQSLFENIGLKMMMKIFQLLLKEFVQKEEPLDWKRKKAIAADVLRSLEGKSFKVGQISKEVG